MVQKDGILKKSSFFSAMVENPKSMRSAFHQHQLSVSWQDLLRSCKVLQLRLSQEASKMRALACLSQAEQTREIAATNKTCFTLFFPKLSQAFCGFSYPRLGTICNMRGPACWGFHPARYFRSSAQTTGEERCKLPRWNRN